MKIFLKTEDEINLMRQANQLVGKTLVELGKHIKPGVTTLHLDRIAEEFIRDHGAIPTFKNFPNPYGEPFPASICTLIDELNRLDITFNSISEKFDTTSHMGRAMMYIASVFAQLERETIAERIRDNMLELAKDGRWLGGNPPTGYKSVETV